MDVIKDVSPVVPCYDGDVDRKLGEFIASVCKERLRLVLRRQQGVYEQFDKEIMREFGK